MLGIVFLGIQLGQVRSVLLSLVIDTMAGHATGDLEQFLADLVRASHGQRFDRCNQFREFPILSAGVELQQFIFQGQRMSGQVGRRIGLVGGQVGDHVECSVHAAPMSRVGTDIGVNTGGLGRLEAECLVFTRLQ